MIIIKKKIKLGIKLLKKNLFFYLIHFKGCFYLLFDFKYLKTIFK